MAHRPQDVVRPSRGGGRDAIGGHPPRAEARARTDAVRQHVEGRFSRSDADAYRAGVMAALGTVLVLVGDLLGWLFESVRG